MLSILRRALAVAVALAMAWLAACPAAIARDQVDPTGRFAVAWWTVDDGLPEAPLTGAAFAPDGTLVCASRSGLVRFNGVSFDPLPDALTAGLHSEIGDFWSIGFDHEGCLWVQGGEAVARLADPFGAASKDPAGRWDIHRLHAGTISSMTFGPDGRPLCIGVDFVMAFDGKVFSPLRIDRPSADAATWRYGAVSPRTGELWLWTGGGQHDIACVRPPFSGPRHGGFVDVRAAAPLPIVTIGFGPAGTWALLPDAAARHDVDGWQRIPPDLPGADQRVRGKLTESADGTVWISSPDGLIACLEGRVETTIESLPGFSQFAHTVLADEVGGVWATCVGGLLTVRRTACRFVPVSNCSAVYERADGTLLIGSPGTLAERRPDAPPGDVLRTIATLPRGAVPTAILETADHRIWVGTQDAFLYRVDGATVTQITKAAAESFRELRSIHALVGDARGRVWVAASSGLAVCEADSDSFTRIKGFGETSPVRIIGLALDHDGSLLVAALGRGIFRLDPDSRRAEQLLPNAQMPGKRSIAFYRDGRNTLWLGGDAGLMRLPPDGPAFRVSAATGLADDAVRQIWEGPGERLWVALRDGRLQGMRLDDLDALAAGRRAMVRGIVLHATSGLGGPECVGRIATAGRRKADGAAAPVHIPLDKGLLLFDPPREPPIRERVRPPIASAAVDATADRMRFAYSSPGMHLDGDPLHQTRLRGLDADWSPPGTARTRVYDALPPGRYEFDVRRLDGETDQDFPVTSLVIEVPLPWWQRPWAIAALMALLVATGMAVSRWLTGIRARRRIAQLERQHERDRDRSRIARDIHDSLGAGLTRMALMSENARRSAHVPTDLGQRLDAIYRDAHQLARTVDEIVWAVNPVNDTLAEFVSFTMQDVEDFARAGGLRLQLDVPDDMPPVALESTLRHHVCLAIREIAQNILRHAHATTMGFAMRFDGDLLRVTIHDDGRGFEVARPAADEQDGLANIRGRINELGGSMSVDSAAGRGTTVTFTVPLHGDQIRHDARHDPRQEIHHATS